MKILDRYFLKLFLTILLFSIAAAILVFVIVDLVEHLDSFIDHRVPISTVINYYLLYLPYILYLILPVGILLASLFSMGHFIKTNEFLAMKASGISLYRIFNWVLFLGIILSFGDLALGESLVPAANKIRMDIYRYQVNKVPKPTTSRQGRIYLQNSPTEFIYINYFDPQPNVAYRVTIQTVVRYQLIRRIDADRMEYRNDKWTLYRVRQREFKGETITEDNLPTLDGSFLTFTPKDLVTVQTAPEEMNYFELRDFIDNLLRSGNLAIKWIVDLHFKLSQPFTNLVIVIFGIPLAAIRRPGGVMVAFGLGVLVCFLYFGCMQITKVMGYNGNLSPEIAAWAANGLFAAAGLTLLFRIRK
jgi:lipopolysaccharide export system permease protein